MRPRRILVVTYGRADRTAGGAQMAMNLAAALRERGHEVNLFATGQAPGELPFWRHLNWHSRSLEAFLDNAGPLDVIDLPAVGISRKVTRVAPTIARSIQPDLRYFLAELPTLGRLRRHPFHSMATSVFQLGLQAVILRRMARADVVLCLGSAERKWTERHFPWLRGRLAAYDNALAPEDRASIAQVRMSRQPPVPGRPLRYLWVGRWAAHKGTRTLSRFLGERVRSNPEEIFTIAGCGRPADRDLAPETLASGRVTVVPAFTRRELPGLLASHDAGLFTSSVEGWGLSLNEMLEAGLTVFAAEAGGASDLRPYFPSQLLPFPPPLAPVLAWPPDDLTLYSQRFSWDRIAARYESEVLEGIAQQGRA
jgi:glycosyltransferase involved in cell wall biosynthesis